MNIEAAGSIFFITVVAYLLRYLYKTGKQIEQEQRELGEKYGRKH